MADLHLNLKSKHFEDIKSGDKDHEYRLCTPYWKKRLEDDQGGIRKYDRVVIKKGYPKNGDPERIIYREYRGWRHRYILHNEFGPDFVWVYAIRVN